MSMNKLELMQLVIAEPVSAITDVMTGVVSLYVAYKLVAFKAKNEHTRHFINYFFLMGCSTILAGILGHGMQHYLSSDWKIVGWSLSAIALFFFQLASISYFKIKLGKIGFNTIISMCIAQLILFHIFILWPDTRSFRVVQLNLTIGYVGFIIPLFLYAFFVWNETNAKRIFAAISVAGLAGMAYNLEVSLHQWFDHNVVSHFIITAFLLVLYSGVIQILDLAQEKEFLLHQTSEPI